MMQVGSCECTKGELELFSLPPTLTSIEKVHHVEVLPLGSLTDYDTPIEFFVAGRGDEYTNLAKTYLYLEAKITKADGTDLEDNAKVGPVNNWFHALFSQVDLSLIHTRTEHILKHYFPMGKKLKKANYKVFCGMLMIPVSSTRLILLQLIQTLPSKPEPGYLKQVKRLIC
jgi:hypothetical protein